MGAFLDALGIQHEDGLIANENVEPAGAEKVRAAAAELGRSYPAEDVALYLSTLMWQDPDAWAPLADVPEIRAGEKV
jgi:hypothetical protein